MCLIIFTLHFLACTRIIDIQVYIKIDELNAEYILRIHNVKTPFNTIPFDSIELECVYVHVHFQYIIVCFHSDGFFQIKCLYNWNYLMLHNWHLVNIRFLVDSRPVFFSLLLLSCLHSTLSHQHVACCQWNGSTFYSANG